MLDYQVTTWDILRVLQKVGTKMDQNANFMVKNPFYISKAVNEKSKGSKIGMKCKNVLIGDVESCWNTARKILIMFNECFCNYHPANDVQIIIVNTFSLAQSCSLWFKKMVNLSCSPLSSVDTFENWWLFQCKEPQMSPTFQIGHQLIIVFTNINRLQDLSPT